MDSPSFRSRWRENHGNLLVAVALLIILAGSIVKVTRDNAAPRPVVNRTPVQESDEDADDRDDEALPPAVSLLQIRISGMSSDEGKVRIALYTDAKSFNQPELAEEKTSADIFEGVANWVVQVPAGVPVAINAFHDQNENGELDRNLLGIPSEKYGYSRGARAPGGPPPFDEAAFVPQAGLVQVPLEIW